MVRKKILVISYTFPPSPNVGGRRWSKLIPHIANDGYEVHVITATPDSHGNYNTKTTGNITVHRIYGGYPSILSSYIKKNLMDKVKYALTTRFLSATNGGNIYDRSVLWKDILQKKIIEITQKENIVNVIVTAPPFQHLFYVADLKEKLSHLNIILDFRDPWVEHLDFKVFYSLSDKRIQCQLNMERIALQNADTIISISEGITEGLRKVLGKSEDKFYTITNGVDISDYAFLKEVVKEKAGKIKIVYYGSLYPRAEDNIEALVGFMNKYKKEFIEAGITFEFCGHVNDSALSVFKRADPEMLIYHGVKPYKVALQMLNEATVGLIIIAKHHEDIQFNTKLMECMVLKKKIFLLGPDGKVGRFLEENNIGVRFSNETIEQMLPWLTDKDKLAKLSYDDFDISPFEYINLAKQVERFFK